MLWKKFKALGSEIVISTSLEVGQKNILDEAEQLVLDFEKNFSRFIKGNELDRFNCFVGKQFIASEMLTKQLVESIRLNQLTQGIFDPTIIGSLEEVGYDKNFTDLVGTDLYASPLDLEEIQAKFLTRHKLDELQIVDCQIAKPKGLRVDFGGLGKGFVVELLSRTVLANVPNYWISAGGDLLIKGSDEAQIGWKIGVQNPSEPEHQIFSIQTKGEKLGIATSGVFKRKGKKADFVWHHLIDPRTGLPVENNILAVTALTGNATEADVFAKTVLILGEEAGLKFIDAQPDAACIIFYKTGGLKFSAAATKYFYYYETDV